MILLSLGGLTTSAVGLFLGLKRVVRGLRSGLAPNAQPDPVFWTDDPAIRRPTLELHSRSPTPNLQTDSHPALGSWVLGSWELTELLEPNPSQLNVTVCICALSFDESFCTRVPALICANSD